MISFLTDWIISIFNAFYGKDEVYKVLEKYTAIYDSFFSPGSSANILQGLQASAAVIGFAFCIFIFIRNTAERSYDKKGGLEPTIKYVVKFIITCVLIFNCSRITTPVVDFGNLLAAQVYGENEINTNFWNQRNPNMDGGKYREYEELFEKEGLGIGRVIILEQDYLWTDYITKLADGIEETVIERNTGWGESGATTTKTVYYPEDTNRYALKQGISRIKTLQAALYLAKALIPYIICMVCSLVVTFVAIIRLVEMSVRTIFMPLAIGDLFANGMHSSGFRYIKKFIAVVMQFVAILLISAICGWLMSSKMTLNSASGQNLLNYLTHNTVDYGFSQTSCIVFIDIVVGMNDYVARLGILIAKILLILKAQTFASDAVGVN